VADDRLLVELHLHTRSSFDSAMTPEAAVAACQRRGITCLAVTDHNRIEAAWEVHRLAPFPVIIGEEIRTSEGELIAYFLQDEIPRGLSPEESIERVRGQGGVVGVPHPFDRFRGGVLKRTTLMRIAPLIDFVEAFNARNLLLRDSLLGAVFARERGLRATVGSDAHTPREVGTAYLRMPAFEDPAGFLAALEQAEMVSRRSPAWVHFFSKWHTWRTRLLR
jgi:predicted metal-dependent phosphoesterase TrpH